MNFIRRYRHRVKVTDNDKHCSDAWTTHRRRTVQVCNAETAIPPTTNLARILKLSESRRQQRRFRGLSSITSCRRAGVRHDMPPPLSSPPWAPKRPPPPSRRQRSSSFPRPTRSHAHRCSRLTRQHGGE